MADQNGSPVDARRLFETRVLGEVFGNTPPDSHPITVFLGGQPGAGKSRGMARALRMHPNLHVTPIVGDDFRQLHPSYSRLLREEPLAMPDVTASLSGQLVGMAVSWANTHKASCLIEGTWRTPPPYSMPRAKPGNKGGAPMRCSCASRRASRGWPRFRGSSARQTPARHGRRRRLHTSARLPGYLIRLRAYAQLTRLEC